MEKSSKISGMIKDTIPQWNLDSLYPNIKTKEYKEAVQNFINGMDEIDCIIKTAGLFSDSGNNASFDFASWLKTFIDLSNKVNAQEESLLAYAYLIYSVDTTNKEFLDNRVYLEDLTLRSYQQHLSFEKILSSNKDRLEEFYKAYPEYEKYRFKIEETIAASEHRMSQEQEDIATAMQQTGGDAWDRLHEQIISNLKDDQTGKTFNELRNDAYSPDPATRKTAWEKEKALLKQNEIAFAACLNNLKGETVTLNKRRSWENAIDRALASSRMSKQTLDALIGSIEESLPQWREYLKAKAKLLAKTNSTVSTDSNGIAFYDLFAPVNCPGEKPDPDSLLEKTWTFDEAKNYIIEKFSSFSSKMGDFAKNAFDKKWIDAQCRAGKVGGAYCQDFPVQKESRVLSNFTGAFSDVITLAHELGHAFHFSCIKDRDYLLCGYPMTLAETASTFAETIVKQDLIRNVSDADKIKILELDLQDTNQVLVDILCRFYFERSVFEERADGELTAEDFNRLMRTAQEKSYGEGLNGERHEYMWAVKSHYYSTGLDFYNFPYAFGQLFASGLYARYLKEGESFVDVYTSLLADTGSMSCEDLCRKAGFDITTKDFWREAMKLYLGEISEFVRLSK